MKILLTNDDGVGAPGLDAMRGIVGPDAIVVAPKKHLSGCSHAVTTWQGAVHVEQRDQTTFAVEGTPADCVRVALDRIVPDADAIVAGINPGGNLGADIYYSGTVAAAREAAFHGRLGIAVSHYRKRDRAIDWGRAAAMTRAVLDDLFRRQHPVRGFWNVNLPHLAPDEPDAEIVHCVPCKQPLPLRYRVDGAHYHYEGDYQLRPADAGADVALCFGGKVTVSLISL
jgi:5'-nucleotidase